MEYVLIVIVAILLGVFLVVVLLSAAKHTEEEETEGVEDINNKVVAELVDADFVIEKILYMRDLDTQDLQDGCKQFLGININEKKLLLIDYSASTYRIVPFSDLMSYEVYVNDSTSTSGVATGIFYGVFTISSKTKVRDLKLIIKLKDINCPYIEYELIGVKYFQGTVMRSVSQNSAIFRNCISDLQKVVSYLDLIISENQKTI